ncbi:immunoglobulin-like domain-containing protein [Paraflavitalea pollutisoli]|uniref:immunoglobulin-like domain-containing protein n=1 Tax=Paraflavitalea pollutisoli TaxID=3034143 RepID=UPI0023ED8054|nr:immunoglobulin-like domain-containing protein [Paraflavitalea sp. H1-2-19X]
MKHLVIKQLWPVVGLCLLFSCAKEPSFNYPEGTVGISKVVNFPSVAIKGERLIIQNQGVAYTEPGVEAFLQGQTVQYATSGTVDANTPGVYELVYSASSPDGYSASDWRTVVIMSTAADVTSNNYAGTYKRDQNGLNMVWTKTGRGLYDVENPGGADAGVGFVVKLVNYQGSKIAIPKQQAYDPSISGLNTIKSTSEVYRPAAVPVTVDWILQAGGYGTGLRTFKKL